LNQGQSEGIRQEKVDKYFKEFELPDKSEKFDSVIEINSFCPIFEDQDRHLRYFMSIFKHN